MYKAVIQIKFELDNIEAADEITKLIKEEETNTDD